MKLEHALLLLLTHGIPILYFTYMSTDVLLRNRKSVPHILLSLISLCYLLLFAEEYVRNQVSIEYSPILSSLWLSSVGILIPGLCFHFIIILTRLDKHFPRFLYPYVFYLPVIFVIINIATGAEFISAQQFVEIGQWKIPVYNNGYYIAMTSSILTDVLYLIPLLYAKAKAELLEHKSIYNQLIFGIVISIIWHSIFGYIHISDFLPPYPYLYSGIIWCYFLRLTMKKQDFLNFYDNRFRKLFTMHPDAILLTDQQLIVQHANPGARKMFEKLPFALERPGEWLNNGLTKKLFTREKIVGEEIELSYHDRRLILLVNADYVWIGNDPHTLLILRDITTQKMQQEEITSLAFQDALTGLPNRRAFHEKLDASLVSTKQNLGSLALMLIDIDKLKLLNETRGHLSGDEVLKQLAHILKETVGDQGFVGRMGSDEFVIYIENYPSKEFIEILIDRIRHRFAEYISKSGLSTVELIFGCSYYPENGTESQALINAADNMIYSLQNEIT